MVKCCTNNAAIGYTHFFHSQRTVIPLSGSFMSYLVLISLQMALKHDDSQRSPSASLASMLHGSVNASSVAQTQKCQLAHPRWRYSNRTSTSVSAGPIAPIWDSLVLAKASRHEGGSMLGCVWDWWQEWDCGWGRVGRGRSPDLAIRPNPKPI